MNIELSDLTSIALNARLKQMMMDLEITRPVLDGDRFESIAAELYPVLQLFF